MNIENRLRKLETRTAVNSEHCECINQHHMELYHQTITEDGKGYTEPVLKSNPVSDDCLRCGKKIEKKVLILCFGSVEHPLQEPPVEAVEAHRKFMERKTLGLPYKRDLM